MKQEIRYWIYQYCSENSIPSLPYNHFISNKLVTIVTRLENIPQMFKNTFLLISNTKRRKIMVNYCFPVFRGVCNSCVILLKVLNKQVYFNIFFSNKILLAERKQMCSVGMVDVSVNILKKGRAEETPLRKKKRQI